MVADAWLTHIEDLGEITFYAWLDLIRNPIEVKSKYFTSLVDLVIKADNYGGAFKLTSVKSTFGMEEDFGDNAFIILAKRKDIIFGLLFLVFKSGDEISARLVGIWPKSAAEVFEEKGREFIGDILVYLVKEKGIWDGVFLILPKSLKSVLDRTGSISQKGMSYRDFGINI